MTREFRMQQAVRRAARMPRRARLPRLSPRRGRGLCLDPDAAYGARRHWPRILDIEERRIRVVAPDVGGGFLQRTQLCPEEIILAALGIESSIIRSVGSRIAAPSTLLTTAHTRDHHYKVTAYADRQGPHSRGRCRDYRRCRNLRVVEDKGPYHEAGDGGARLARPPTRSRTTAPGTTRSRRSKTPLGPYRGVGRPGACFVIERLVR